MSEIRGVPYKDGFHTITNRQLPVCTLLVSKETVYIARSFISENIFNLFENDKITGPEIYFSAKIAGKSLLFWKLTQLKVSTRPVG